MAVYETATATDVADLLSKLRTFALANGWTQNYYGARTSGSGNALQINKGGNYVTFKTDTGSGTANDPGPYFGCYAHDTYNSGNGTESQANASQVCLNNSMSGPYVAYHFISGTEKGSEFLHVIVEVSSGIFKHTGTGTIVKIGAITSGQFVYGSRWHYSTAQINAQDSGAHGIPFDCYEGFSARNGVGTQLRADADTITWRWLEGCYSTSPSGKGMRGGFRQINNAAPMMGPSVVSASALTGRNVIFPLFLFADRSGGLISPIGYPPGIRYVNMTYLGGNDILTIGTDQWKCFPVIRKNGASGQVNSGVYGFAYKVN